MDGIPGLNCRGMEGGLLFPWSGLVWSFLVSSGLVWYDMVRAGSSEGVLSRYRGIRKEGRRAGGREGRKEMIRETWALT